MTKPHRPGLRSIVFDCDHPMTLARFWEQVIPGYKVRPHGEDDLAWLREHGFDGPEDDPSVVIDPTGGGGPTIWFNKVPEGKVAKNRVHIDVNVESSEDVERIVSLGATVLRPLGAVEDEPWAILADPEGNEFCAFPPPAGD